MEMQETGISKKIEEEIIFLAKKHKVRKVILFGSRARGDFWRASDIDLAVYEGDIINFALDVEENTSTLLHFDIIDMGKTHKPEFLESVLKEGKLIYEKI